MPEETNSGRTGRGRPSPQDTGTMEGQDLLAIELGHVARALQETDDSGDLLNEIVTTAVHMVPGAEHGSIADVIAHRRIQHKAASSDLARGVDLLMQETGQGPCLDAAWEHTTVRVDDTSTEQRWPRFAKLAAEAGVRSMLSIQLYVKADDLGALNLYSGRAGAFTDESEHVGLLVAAHAAVAYADAQRQDQLERAIDTRDLIGRAIGITMERYQIPGNRAFAVLARLSQQSNRKLHDLADELVRATEKRYG
ncbi:GAF and ANTAR domain-containing protein [Kribbella sp. NPDC003557]|uniref:GAF and ANTAR domain-containing protein n=1 Tax=Kribbella sp. NPDC003557 TaxID=3154449 RepID=UPI0033A1FD52